MIATNPHPENFKAIPENPYFLVNELGDVWSVKLQRLVKISVQKSGYCTVAQATASGVKTFYVHRLVASAFIEIPKHVLDYPGRPEVNHKDGDKGNNKKSNLEWVTPRRNIKHSIETGLTNHKAVEAKHVLSDHLMRFPTATDCAKHFGIPWRRLVRHLNSDKAGLLTKNWYVFRYEDNCDWPHIPEDRKIEDRWEKSHGLWFVTHEGTGNSGFTETLHKLAEVTKIPYNTLQSDLRRDGDEYRLGGYVFWYDEYPTAEAMKASDYKKEHGFKETKQVRVTNTTTKESEVFPSMRSFSKKIGVHPRTIEYNIDKYGFYKEYVLKVL